MERLGAEDINEVLYRLIYHRSFRLAFLANQAPLSEDLLHELANLDRTNLQKTAEAVLNQFLGTADSLGFQREFKRTLELWRELFPVDELGLELVYLFLESPQFEEVHNVASAPGSGNLPQAFRGFLLNKLPSTAQFERLRESLRTP
jgi:hypothetical protein